MKEIVKLTCWIVLIVILFTTSCKKEFSCENCKGNQPPKANAGPDQTIILPKDSILLNGQASSDPDGVIVSFHWIKLSGPTSFQIDHQDSSKSMVRNLIAGVYQFELTVTDNGTLSSKDTMMVIVDPIVSTNHAPVANAGPDQVIILPTNTYNLNGSASSDPDNNITSYLWTKIAGPASFNIVSTTAVQTQVSNLELGIYLFVLKVTDAGGLFSLDTIQLKVNAAQTSNCNITNRPLLNAQLIPNGNLLQARFGMAIASAGNKILFAGGYTSFSISSIVDVYDIATNSWSTTSLSIARGQITTAVLGNKIFFAGGVIAGGYSSRIDIYDAVMNTWTTAELSVGRAFMAGAAAGDKVLFAGGVRNGISYTESMRVDVFDASNNSWSVDSLRDRSVAASLGIAATAIGDKIYFAGACGDWFAWDYGSEYSSTINIYDVSTGIWSTSHLSQAKGAMAAITVGNKNIWAGGTNWTHNQFQYHPYLTEVEIMDMNSGTTTFDCLFQGNSRFTAVQKNNTIVFFTADEDWNLLYSMNKFDIYDIATNSWSIGVLPNNIKTAAIISVNNTIYVAGGYVNGTLTNQVWKLNF